MQNWPQSAQRMDPEVREAFRRSNLRFLSDATLQKVAADASVLTLPPGGRHHEEGTTPRPAVVMSGLLRVFVTAPDGRQITIRYARRSALLAIAAVFSPIPSPGGTEALMPTRLLMLRAPTLRRLAHADIDVANALLADVAERMTVYVDEVVGMGFSSMQQRLVRHLLDAATTRVSDGALVARLSQQQLANATGTAREVVVRILRTLREEGAIRTSRGEVVLVDPARLHAGTFPRPS